MKTSELILSVVFMVYRLIPCFDCSGEHRRWGRAGTVTFDRTCPTDCSQGPRITGDSDFNCTIGNLSEVKKFRANFATKMKNSNIDFDPPKLLNIDFYNKQFSDNKHVGALNITFQLPKGKVDGMHEMKMTNAILLHFQSVQDKEFGDTYYYENPRERIFRFLDYTPSSFYDADHPRNISYDCMVGLNDSKPRRVYMITLESAFGRSVTYNCTVRVQQGGVYTTTWHPTIATSLNTSDKSVQVVFGKFPWKPSDDWKDQFKTVYYNVSLLGSNRRVVTYKRLKQEKHEHVFSDLKYGQYFISVSKCEETYDFNNNPNNLEIRKCVSAESYIIDATGIPKEFHADHDTLYMTLAVGLGCLIGVTLVAALILIFLKTRKKPPSRSTSFEGAKKPAGLIVSRPVTNPNVIKKFALYLQNICGCVIYADVLESNRKELEQIESWFSNKLEKSSFVIIVCSKGPVLDAESFYDKAIVKAIEKRSRSNNIRIFLVKFSLGPDETIPRQLGTSSVVFHLMEDFEKLYCRIHSVTNQSLIKMNFKQYHLSKEGSELKIALETARKSTEPKVPLESKPNKETVAIDKEGIIDMPKPCSHKSFEKELKMEDIKREMEDINISLSSINTFASDWNEPDRDSDSDAHEHEPLLESRHMDAIKRVKQNGVKIEGPISSFNRRRHYSEGYPSQRKPNYIEEFPAHCFESRIECKNNYRPAIRRDFSLEHTCEHQISSRYQPVLKYNQNTVAESEQICQHKIPSELYKSKNEQGYIYQNQRNPYHMHPVGVNNAPYICPRHGSQKHEHSPKLDKRYMCSMNEPYGERIYNDYNPNKAYQSYPQDHYNVYENRENHDLFLPNTDRYMPRLEFSAVDPQERRNISHEKDEAQFDSGYKSDRADALYMTNNGSELRNAEDRIKSTEPSYINQTNNESGQKSDQDNEQTVQREGKISSAGRYSYPLSLSIKRDFHCDMFIPPEDLESCLSEQDGGSSTDIMDQLAEINFKK